MGINWVLVGFVAINVTFSTLGDTAAKLWAVNYGHAWLWVSVVINIFTQLTFMLVIRESGLAVGSTIALLLTIITTSCIGLFIFREQINTGQWLGITLGLVAAMLLLNIIKIP